MLDTIREAPIGQFIRFFTRNNVLKYPEERVDFELPTHCCNFQNADGVAHGRMSTSDSLSVKEFPVGDDDITIRQESHENDEANLATLARTNTFVSNLAVRFTTEEMRRQQTLEIAHTKTILIIPQKTEDGIILVDWYPTDDPANPQNWSPAKKSCIVFILCIYTWTVYLAGPVYVPSEYSGILEEYGISPVAGTLGLSLYILAYGVGDLLFSPLTEIPVIGRNPVYYLTFIVFWALSFGPPNVKGFGGFLALRFWLGFFGSPALANRGATAGDMYSLIYIPYGLCWWVLSAWCGPAFGPIIGEFATMAKGWR